MSHLVEATHCEVIPLERPFSSFEFVEQRFLGSPPIRKLFSISRCRDGKSLVIETVPPAGHVIEENEDLTALDPGFRHLGLVRISFWKPAITADDLMGLESKDCLGYALLKHDFLTLHGRDYWHVYEAVIRAYPHVHNFVNARAKFPFAAGGKRFEVEGCLYAQQNGANKTCAQVAIRSVVSTYFKANDLSYRRINDLAAVGNPGFHPSHGLTNREITTVLHGLGIEHYAVDYREIEGDPDPHRCIPTIREDLPYQKFLYSGIESGSGALMAFSLSGPAAPRVGHLIPFFGHTFNEDSWVPNAEPAYFQIGENIRYIPSRSWLSSFIAHDDNFGANLCVPQSFIDRARVSCVFELLPQGWSYSGVEAEFAAADYFYSILPSTPHRTDLPWLGRLRDYVAAQRLILRHVPITWTEYLQELGERRDWEGNTEAADTIEEFRAKGGPEEMWMVEVSVPEVFPTNKRKLGEILLDATRDLSADVDGSSFVLARLPGYFVFFDSLDAHGVPSFTFTPNSLKSHTQLHTKGAVVTD